MGYAKVVKPAPLLKDNLRKGRFYEKPNYDFSWEANMDYCPARVRPIGRVMKRRYKILTHPIIVSYAAVLALIVVLSIIASIL